MLLNHLFGKKRIAKRLEFDAEQRIRIWQEHLDNFPKRENLVKAFAKGTPQNPILENTLRDSDTLRQILRELRKMISEDLVHIHDEEMIDEELQRTLERLLYMRTRIGALQQAIAEEARKAEALRKVFREYYNLLRGQLHLIKAAEQCMNASPPDSEKLRTHLAAIFQLVFYDEAAIWKVFQQQGYFNKGNADTVQRLAHAILLEEEIVEEIDEAKEKFVRTMVAEMAKEESRNAYRKLGEDIFSDVFELAGGPFRTAEEFEQHNPEFERLLKDEATLAPIVRKYRPKYNEEKVRWTVEAFIEACERTHFEDFEGELRS